MFWFKFFRFSKVLCPESFFGTKNMRLRNCFWEKLAGFVAPFLAFLVFSDLLKLFVLNSLESHVETELALVLTGMGFETLKLRFRINGLLVIFSKF